MDRRLFVTLLNFFFALCFLYLVYRILASFIDTLGWACAIGIATYPLYRRLKKQLPGRDTLTASIMTPLVIITLVVPFILFMFFLAGEVSQSYQYLEKVTAGGGPDFLGKLSRNPTVQPVLQKVRPLLDMLDLEVSTTFLPALEKLASFLLGYSTAILKNFFLMIIKLVLMVITLFFLYRDGEAFLQRLLSVLPLEEAESDALLDTVRRVLSAVIYGVLLTCLVQGILGGIGFWFSGLPSPVLFGALMAVAALVPVVGTALIWLPGGLWLIAGGDVAMGIVLLAWGMFVVGMIDNLLRPLFISGRAHISLFIVALGVLGGVFAFGPLGAVTGPIILALFIAVFEIYARRVFPGGSSCQENGEEVFRD
jgi:predicted PurR-regulated permease PerM